MLFLRSRTKGFSTAIERVLESAQRACRRVHQEVAPARSELARALWALGDRAAARAQLEHALLELPRICGYKGRVAGRAHAALAQLLQDAGDREAASTHAAAAVAALAADYGAGHPLCKSALQELAPLL